MKHLSTYFDVFWFMLSIVLPHVIDGATETTIRASASSRVVVPCTSSISADVMWSFQTMSPGAESVEVSMNGLILKGFEDRFELDKSNVNQYNLVIRSARFGDAGQYTCDEQNGIGDRHVVHLDVSGVMTDYVSIHNSAAFVQFATTSSIKFEAGSGEQAGSQNVGLLAAVGVLSVTVLVAIVVSVILLVLLRARRRQTAEQQTLLSANKPGKQPEPISKGSGSIDIGVIEQQSALELGYTTDDSQRVRDTLIFNLVSQNRELFTYFVELMAKHITEKLSEQPDVIIGLNGHDSRGDILALEVSGRLQLRFVEMVQSKGAQGYGGNVFKHTFSNEMPGNSKADYTLEVLKDACAESKKVVIIDNSVLTGATMKAAVHLATNELKVKVVGCMCLVKDTSYPDVEVTPPLHHMFQVHGKAKL